MRIAVLALLAGCYSPTVTSGAPCDLAIGNCPRPLSCLPGPTGATCELPGTRPDAAPQVDAATDAAPDGPTIDAALDAPQVNHVEYVSVVADCVDPVAPDPEYCIEKNGTGRMAVDADDTSSGNGWEGYVRFDLDGTIAGRVVTSVKLQLTATGDGAAAASNSGVVWQVGAFTRASLFVAVPATVGGTPVAPSQGNVDPNDVVVWTLPNSLPAANAPLFLKLSSSSSDGALYHNQTNTKPPKLLIDLQ